MTVPAKSTLTLSFSDKPTNINVNISSDNKAIKQKVIDGKIEVPELKGSFKYEVVANWRQATVTYRFLVNVN